MERSESRFGSEIGELSMKNFFYLAICLFLFANCSTTSTVKNDVNATNVNVTNVSVANVNSAASNQQAANVETKTESEEVKLHDPMKMSRENIEIGKNKKGGAAEPINATSAFTNAADNSTISSSMNAQGVPIETRAFRDNPLLLKVEKSLENPKNPQIKVFLKNGKVINLPANKISNPSNASANEILIAVGALPKPAPQKNEAKTEIEKSEQ
jgi:hypothetical protein